MTLHTSSKKLTTTDKEEENVRSSNTCWICEKLIDDDEIITDHCHITRKCRGTGHWSCNANLKMTKEVFIIYHNLKDYDSNFIMKVIIN